MDKTQNSCYSVACDEINKEVLDDFEFGKILVQVSNLQKAIKNCQNAVIKAREDSSWEMFAYHLFYYGRLTQGLHSIKDKYKLDIRIPDPLRPNLPSFISRKTRDNFPEIG